MKLVNRIHRNLHPNRHGHTFREGCDFKAWFESAPDPCLVLDRQYRIVAANEAYLRSTRTSRQGLVGRRMFDVFPDNPDERSPTAVKNLSASFRRVLKERVTDVMEIQKYDIPVSGEKGFERRYWSPINAPVLGRDGEVAYIIHRVRDVTSFVEAGRSGAVAEGTGSGAAAELLASSREVSDTNVRLKEANDALQQQSEDRERLLAQLETVLEGIKEAVVISDVDGNVLRMNRQALALHDYEDLEQARKHLTAYRGTFEVSDEHGESLPLAEWPLGQVLRGDDFIDREFHVRRRDSGKSWDGSYSGTLVRDRNGKPLLAVLTIHDITEKKRIVDELRTVNQQLQVITETMPVGVVRCNKDRRCSWVSSQYAKWMGLAPDLVVGKPMWEVIGDEAYGELSPYVDRVLAGEEVSFEARINYGYGGPRWISGRYAPTFDSNGAVDGWVAVIFDISERKDLEERVEELNRTLATRVAELEEANRDLGSFTRMVSHDLRQPLNTIGTSCQAIKMLCAGQLDEKCSEFVEIAYNKVFAMNDLIDSLMKFSRSTHGELQRTEVDLSSMAREVAADLRTAKPERHAVFRIEDGVTATGDANLLRSVLENLIGNAWKYTEQKCAAGGEAMIEFGTTEMNGNRVLFVKDNGSGFEMAETDKLFTPFQRLPGAEKTKGFGVGLATVERIIRRHGGRIWAEGEPGQGAIFYFTLPSTGPDASTGERP